MEALESHELQEMAAKSLGWQVRVPAGSYFLGDPCYAVPRDEWENLLHSNAVFHLPVGQVRGFQVLGFETKYGDGTYYDQEGIAYLVDAGLIGLTPLALNGTGTDNYGTPLDELGRLVTFDHDVTVSVNEAGVMEFGHIKIDTDPPYDEDEDDPYGGDER